MNVYDLQLVNDGRILHHLGVMLQRDEHNAARPGSSFFSAASTNATTGNIPLTRCAWCDREAGIKPSLDMNQTHGICPRHHAGIKAQLDDLRRMTA